jgi:hypothetical protein
LEKKRARELKTEAKPPERVAASRPADNLLAILNSVAEPVRDAADPAVVREHAQRAIRSCAMKVHDPYGVVRTSWEQIDALKKPPLEVVVDDVDGRPVAPIVSRPQPQEPRLTVQQQIAYLLGKATAA